MRFKVLDGGSATELVRLGYPVIDRDPLWSARLLHTNPDAILKTHKNFVNAGADFIITTSYQAWVPGLVQHLAVSEMEAYNLIKRSVQIAKQACEEACQARGSEVKVAGSVGPYGASLHDGSEYNGHYLDHMSIQELQDWHRPRLKALCEAGADILAIETIPGQKEAEAIVRLIENEFPNIPCWVTYACKEKLQTCHGERFIDAINSIVHSPRVIAVGVNCTDPHHISPLLNSLQEININKPIIVKPNSGEQWKPNIGWYGRESLADICTMVPDWVECGATWIGGCCRITPDDISNIRQLLLQLSDSR